MSSQEGFSTNKAPLFNGTNYTFWKVTMQTYLMLLKLDVWGAIEHGYEKPLVIVDKDDKL